MTKLYVDPKYLKNSKNYDTIALGNKMGEYDIEGEWGFKYLYKTCLFFNDTNQIVIATKVPENFNDYKKLKMELKEMMKYIIENKEGYKRIQLHEHTQGELGTYSIQLKNDDWFIVKTCYGVPTYEKIDINALIENIKQNHYAFNYYDEEDDE